MKNVYYLLIICCGVLVLICGWFEVFLQRLNRTCQFIINFIATGIDDTKYRSIQVSIQGMLLLPHIF